MAALTLSKFRDVKRDGFLSWETAQQAGTGSAYLEPVDARYGAPSFPFGTDPATTGPAFERWCSDQLKGEFYVTAGPWTGLVYCQLKRDVVTLQNAFAGAPPGG